MDTEENWHEARRLHLAEHLSCAAVARRIGVSERTVRRWVSSETPPAPGRARPSRLDASRDLVMKIGGECDFQPSRVLGRLRELGIDTSLRSVQRFLALHRPQPAPRVYNQLSFTPGEAAQTDFGSCGFIELDGHRRRLSVCVTVLCHSRMLYAEFIPCERLEHFLSCQLHAFEAFGGAPRNLIVDNCKCAVLRHEPGRVTWNPDFQAFCGHYRIRPVACTPRTPWAKGIVERMVGYVKDAFVRGRCFFSLEEANSRLQAWLEEANMRTHGTTRMIPAEMLGQERKALLELAGPPFPCRRLEMRNPDRYCRISFDGNFYSLPPEAAGKTVEVSATPAEVICYQNGRLLTSHRRNYGRNNVVEKPEHVAPVRRRLPAAGAQNARRDFLALGGSPPAFLEGLESRSFRVISDLRCLLALHDMYGTELFQRSLGEAVRYHAFQAAYVENLLKRKPRPDNDFPLRIPRAGDQMNIRTPEPSMEIYSLKQHTGA